MSVLATEAPQVTVEADSTAEAVVVVPPTPTLNRYHDRCDDKVSDKLAQATGQSRCGAQAFMKAKVRAGGELLFCAHHGGANLPKLKLICSEIVDERSFINTAPSVSANHQD